MYSYTKQMKAKDTKAQRYMMEINVLDYRVFDGIEFARVFLKGQSFLYNQIRKMMGAVFMIMHYGLPESFIDNSFKDNEVNVPTAPGEGLMLNRVAYDRYNRERHGLKEMIRPWDSKLEEIEEYRVELVNYICSTEKQTYAFSKWLAWMHESRGNFMG
jgi:tRNA pseudouridine38-40 synthase